MLVAATTNQPDELVRHVKALIQLATQEGREYVTGMQLVASADNPSKFVFIARYKSAEARLTFRKSEGFIKWDVLRKQSGAFLNETYEFFNDVGIGFRPLSTQ